jgi:hypothetical protein
MDLTSSLPDQQRFRPRGVLGPGMDGDHRIALSKRVVIHFSALLI